ncbi:MAG: hypothetical protein NC911_10145 [Candidatus Omnitrophica bacterium]|nr:hypothetical protein [Candidatus Omnitrophota bacterium]
MGKIKGRKVLLAVICFLAVLSLWAENEFTLNFNNVDIRTFIKFVSEFTRENYVLDNNVRGNITIYSQKPVPAREIDTVFRSVLHLYGFAVVKKGHISEIIPVQDARIRTREINLGKVPPEKESIFLHQIVPLRYCDANTLAQLLAPYLSKGSSITVEQRTNTLIIPDVGANIAKLMEIIEKIDVPSPPGKEEYRVYRLENSNAEELAKVLNDILSKKRVTPAVRAPGVSSAPVQASVVAAKATNSLIIYADPDEFATLEKIIKELDVMTNQVLIEALIAEVTYDREREFGFEWNIVDTFWKDKISGSVETKFDLDKAIPAGMKVAIAKGISDISSIIRLYAKDQRFNILSTPQIVTADNQEAMINISENRPYLKETRFIGTYYTGAGQDTIKSFDYKDVGIILKITPQISRDKYVKLKINQSVTKVLTVGTQGELTTAKREADTTLIVPNNQTVVLGGLIRNDTEKVIHKVPFFGDIPVVKHLFRHQRDAGTKTNLLIFITPRIITSFEEAERLRQEKEKAIQEIKK